MERNEINSPAEALIYFHEQYPQRFSEIYQVLGTYEFVSDLGELRLDSVRNLKTGKFDVRRYVKDSGTGGWKEWHNQPWLSRDTEAETFAQALSFF